MISVSIPRTEAEDARATLLAQRAEAHVKTVRSDGLPVFTGNAINFALDGESNWVTINRMPPAPSSTIPYTLVDSVVAPPGPLAVTLSGGQVSLAWPVPATLQACDSLTSGSWTNVPSAAGSYAAPASGTKLFFRLMR